MIPFALVVQARFAAMVLSAVLAIACGDDSAPPDPTPSEPETPAPPEPPATPEGDPLPERAPTLACGGAHTCYLDGAGLVRCWGEARFGQIADPAAGSEFGAHRTSPFAPEGLQEVVAIAAGAMHTCALFGDHAVRCFGHDAWGQVSGALADDARAPVVVEGLDHPVELALGRQHTCARLADRSVRCFGDNAWGQLGDGTLEARRGPVAVRELDGVVMIAAGRDHTCALEADGAVACWGAAIDGQLGVERERVDAVRVSTPVVVADAGEGVRALTAGSAHTCALLASGGVRCWGANDAGQLGTPAAPNAIEAPADVPGIEGAAEVVAGSRFNCARLASGEVRCWGANAFMQLGDGTDEVRSGPVAVMGVADAVEIGVGSRFACALRRSGHVACWGANERAQLGDGTNEKREQPVAVHGL